MRKYIHRIINLDVHMVADGRQLLPLCGDHLSIPALDLVGRRAFFSEASSDDDAIAIYIMFIRLVALVLQLNRDFGSTFDNRVR